MSERCGIESILWRQGNAVHSEYIENLQYLISYLRRCNKLRLCKNVGNTASPIKFSEKRNWTGLDWTGLDWTGLDWTGLDWTGLDWTGLDWTGLDWTGLDWTGLDWKGNVYSSNHEACQEKYISFKV